MLDFSQYKFGEAEKVERRTISRTKSTIFLVIAFCVLFVAVAEFIIFAIIGFPKQAPLAYAIPNAILTLGSLVMIFISGANSKFIRTQGEDNSRSKCASAVYLLSSLILATMLAVLVVRIINPEFLPVL